MAVTRYYLGSVALTYTEFVWSLYRGAMAKYIQIDQGAHKYNELCALPRVTSLRIECSIPRQSGGHSITFQGVRIIEVVLVNKRRCYVIVADPRADWERYINSRDLNVQFEDGILAGTQEFFAVSAIDKLGKNNPNWRNVIPRTGGDHNTVSLDLPLSGMALPKSLEYLNNDTATALTIRPNGDTAAVGKSDTDVPPMDFIWLENREPGWQNKSRKRFGLPKYIDNYFTERHCLRVQNEDNGDKTYAAPEAMRVETENVFAVGEKFCTVPELLAHFNLGYLDTFIDNDYLCRNVLRKNWELPLQRDGSFEIDAVIAILARDFRNLRRIKYPNGQRGMWVDPVFGKPDLSKLTTDLKTGKVDYSGVVYAAPAECEWVEIFDVVSPGLTAAGVPTLIGAEGSRNHTRTSLDLFQLPQSPFIPVWVNKESGVFRLTTKAAEDGTVIYPGNLVEPLKVDWTSSAPAASPAVPAQPLSIPYVIEKTNLDQMKFKTSFDLHVFITMTRRTPNNHKRYHRERIKAFDKGDIENIELEVPASTLCFRDYVDPTHGRPQESDGLGRVLNAGTINNEATIRAAEVVAELGRKLEGEAEAIGIAPLLQGLELRGAVSEIQVHVKDQVVTTVIKVGNLADPALRSRTAAQRVAKLKAESGGKEITLA